MATRQNSCHHVLPWKRHPQGVLCVLELGGVSVSCCPFCASQARPEPLWASRRHSSPCGFIPLAEPCPQVWRAMAHASPCPPPARVLCQPVPSASLPPSSLGLPSAFPALPLFFPGGVRQFHPPDPALEPDPPLRVRHRRLQPHLRLHQPRAQSAGEGREGRGLRPGRSQGQHQGARGGQRHAERPWGDAERGRATSADPEGPLQTPLGTWMGWTRRGLRSDVPSCPTARDPAAQMEKTPDSMPGLAFGEEGAW